MIRKQPVEGRVINDSPLIYDACTSSTLSIGRHRNEINVCQKHTWTFLLLYCLLLVPAVLLALKVSKWGQSKTVLRALIGRPEECTIQSVSLQSMDAP